MADILEQFMSGASTSHSNIFGGENYFDEMGHKIGYSKPNIFGGNDVFDDMGHKVMATKTGLMGGTDVFGGDGLQVASTVNTVMGEQLFGQDQQLLGTFQDGGLPDMTVFQDTMGCFHSWKSNLMGGMTADPLKSMHCIHFPKVF